MCVAERASLGVGRHCELPRRAPREPPLHVVCTVRPSGKVVAGDFLEWRILCRCARVPVGGDDEGEATVSTDRKALLSDGEEKRPERRQHALGRKVRDVEWALDDGLPRRRYFPPLESFPIDTSEVRVRLDLRASVGSRSDAHRRVALQHSGEERLSFRRDRLFKLEWQAENALVPE